MSSMTITEFLAARLDEDESVARTVEGEPAWTIADRGRGSRWHRGLLIDVMDSTWDACIPVAAAEHTVRHDPARVLAEVEAKRRIVAMHGQAVAIDAVLDLLALPYAEHPDWREEWRP